MNPRPAGTTIGVLGAGSWGTALAIALSRGGAPAVLWGRDSAGLADLARNRINARYLPEARCPDALAVEASLPAVVRGQRDLLICVPSRAFRELLQAIRPHLRPDSRIAWASKGFEQDSGLLPNQVARTVLGDGIPLAVLSGPTFAKEVAAGLPTAMTVAASDGGFARDLAQRISDTSFRAYTSDDMTGVEVGGAMKNVLAIAAGISDGLGFGANARIALINRGLAEMTRLGVALGARPATFMGLSGMGDLVLTCTDNQSRNRRLGLAIAAGVSAAQAATSIGQAVEGWYGARSTCEVAARLGVDLPICREVYRVLFEAASPRDSVMTLMSRSLKTEDPGL